MQDFSVSKRPLRIVFLEDEQKDFTLVKNTLAKSGLNFRLIHVQSNQQFQSEIDKAPDVILSDHHLPEFDGFAALKVAHEKCPDVPFIFVSGTVGEEKISEALKRGAVDIVPKDQISSLVPAICRALELSDERSRREHAEEALQHSEDRYRRLVEMLPCAVILHRHGRIIFANPAAARLAGVNSAARLVGRDVSEFVSSEYQRLVHERIETIEHAPTAPFIEAQFARPDGVKLDVQVAGTSVVLSGEDQEPAAMVVVIDVTEQKRAQEEVKKLNTELEERVQQRTADLEAAVHELEAFSYSISHDLRAPLRHIDGFADLLRQGAGKLDTASTEYLDIIVESARQMGKLIDALLTFSRMSRVPLARTRVNLKRLAEAVIHDLRYEAEGRQVEWQVGSLPEVAGDSTLLRQVLVNLLSNALKYTRPRQTPRIEITSTETPTEYIIQVRDNGIGFDMQFADKLFGVFQRLHSSNQFEGIGIGLANVRRIIQRHGGRTWAEAKLDQGASFYFTLPKSEHPG